MDNELEVLKKKVNVLWDVVENSLEYISEVNRLVGALMDDRDKLRKETEQLKKRLEEIELEAKPIGQDMEGVPNLFRVGRGESV
jgi:regulator of replication initiation timing